MIGRFIEKINNIKDSHFQCGVLSIFLLQTLF